MDWGDGQTAIGALPGAQVQVTVTFPLFHPAAFGEGEIVPTIDGAAVAIFNVTLVLAEFPAASVAVPLIT